MTTKTELKTIGALWEKEGRAGKFLSGNIDVKQITGKVDLMVFRNNSDNPNAPQWRIVCNPDDQRKGGTVELNELLGFGNNPEPQQQPVRDAVADDEIPF